MRHSNLLDKSNPDNAELAYELDAILEPYDDILGDIQIPWTIAKNIVNAHRLGQRSRYESKLDEYKEFVTEHSPVNTPYQRTIAYYSHVREVKRTAIQKGTWQGFIRYVDKVLDRLHSANSGNMQIVYYSMIDV